MARPGAQVSATSRGLSHITGSRLLPALVPTCIVPSKEWNTASEKKSVFTRRMFACARPTLPRDACPGAPSRRARHLRRGRVDEHAAARRSKVCEACAASAPVPQETLREHAVRPEGGAAGIVGARGVST